MDRRWAAAADRKMPWEGQELHRRLGRRPPGTTRCRPPSELRLPVRRAERTPQQSRHFFLNVDDDFGFTQLFAEVLILAAQLLVFLVEGAALGLGATLLWRQCMQDSRGAFVPPRHQVRGVQALTSEQGADATGLLLGFIGLGQDTLLVLAREDASLGSGDDLGVGAVSGSLVADRFGLASLGLTAVGDQGGRECLRCLRYSHAVFPSRPAL